MLLLALAKQSLPCICHSVILIHLARLLVQGKEVAQLLGPLDLVALLSGLGNSYWLSVSCFRSTQMGPLVGYLLVVELGTVPGTMGPGCSQPIVVCLGSVSQAALLYTMTLTSLFSTSIPRLVPKRWIKFCSLIKNAISPICPIREDIFKKDGLAYLYQCGHHQKGSIYENRSKGLRKPNLAKWNVNLIGLI